jgi:hypothetical protein
VDTVVARGRVLVQNGQPLVRGPWEDPSGRGPIIADHELRT